MPKKSIHFLTDLALDLFFEAILLQTVQEEGCGTPIRVY
jgi:hypothetical protein